jgi:hypothetical protein
MAYVKSIFVGIAASVIMMVVSTIVWMVIVARQIHRQFPAMEISFDLRSMLSRPSVVWLVVGLAFIAGFYWQFRRGRTD